MIDILYPWTVRPWDFPIADYELNQVLKWVNLDLTKAAKKLKVSLERLEAEMLGNMRWCELAKSHIKARRREAARARKLVAKLARQNSPVTIKFFSYGELVVDILKPAWRHTISVVAYENDGVYRLSIVRDDAKWRADT